MPFKKTEFPALTLFRMRCQMNIDEHLLTDRLYQNWLPVV